MKKILLFIMFISLYAFNLPNNNVITNRCVDVVDVSPSGEIFSNLKTKIKNKSSIENIKLYCPILNIYKISVVNENDEEIGTVTRTGMLIYPKFERISKSARYKIEYQGLNGKRKIEYSSDRFCVRPYTFTFKVPNNVYEGNMIKIEYKAIDYIGNDTSYEDEPKLKGKNLKYSLHKHYFYALFRDGKHNITLYDEHFCDIDKNDTKLDDRTIQGSFDVDVKTTSKYWSGVGTGESENNPKHNTINVDVKQNVFKDMKYNKVDW